MRRIIIVLLAALTVGLASVPVRAVDVVNAQISDAQLQQIKQNCKQAQSELQRLQTTDVATRVNRGRIYESLLNNLIAPFNSRVSLNRSDASILTTTTTAISQKFTDFKNDYVTYSDLLARTLSVDCESNPSSFYNLLVATRTARTAVATDVTDLNGLLDSYTSAYGTLRTTILGANS